MVVFHEEKKEKLKLMKSQINNFRKNVNNISDRISNRRKFICPNYDL